MRIPAITLYQPWAHLVIHGAGSEIKDVENRVRPMPGTIIGKRVGIHAAKVHNKESFRIANDFLESQNLPLFRPFQCEFGALIGIVRAVDSVQGHPSIWAARIHPLSGRPCWNWILADPWAIEPIPMLGWQGIRYLEISIRSKL